MEWNLEEAISHYRALGAPGDQNTVISLLREVQRESGGAIPAYFLPKIAAGLGTKEALLTALIRRIPSLQLGNSLCLELCAGPNCGKHTALSTAAEKLCAAKKVELKFVPCMRMCGKGPNLRWKGQLYHRSDEALLRRLLEEA